MNKLHPLYHIESTVAYCVKYVSVFILFLITILLSSPSFGQSIENTDYEPDFDASVNSGQLAPQDIFPFYVDADGDGYGAGVLVFIDATDEFTAPPGYSLNNLDCVDTSFAINPAQPELLYNGFDDNCNNQLDEGSQLTTQIQASQCGGTLTSINSLIVAVYMPGSSAYRFHVTNTTTGVVQTIIKGVPYFTLTQLASYDYSTTYSIKIELQKNGIWLGYYGIACNVLTPAVLAPGGAAQIITAQCGTTLPIITTLISTNSLQGVTGYRFRVINITTPDMPVQTIDRISNWFSLPMLQTYNYGTTYLIQVAVKTNGVFSGFGNPCSITTPAVPSLTNCVPGGFTAIQFPSSRISVVSLQAITSYRFEITDLGGTDIITFDRIVNWFNFNILPYYTPGGQYAVRVTVMTSGVYSPWSDSCEITAPGGGRIVDTKEGDIDDQQYIAIASPNPFTDTFTLRIDDTINNGSKIEIYDMSGRLIESRNHISNTDNLIFGDKYSTGIYQLVIYSGEIVRTFKMVKK